MSDKTSDRKLEHIEVCLEEDVESRFKTTGFEDIDLIPATYPQIDFEDIDLSSTLFGKDLEVPLVISPMTGGHEKGREINLTLAEAAQELGVAFAVGSQRAAIEDPSLKDTYQVRDVAPDILLLGNLGVVQFAQGYGLEEAQEAIEMIDADALGLHFNALQEVIQPGGDMSFKGALDAVSEVIDEFESPIYVKETGAGMIGSRASEFEGMGAEAIDVSGAGGTSWAGVEAMREGSSTGLGEVFWDWGIPTSVSTAEVSDSVDVPVISSGGIRTGLDAAKAYALGADFVGVGLPLFRSSVRGKERVVEWLEEFLCELKVAMFLSGCGNIEALRGAPLKISGLAREWFFSRGMDPNKYRR